MKAIEDWTTKELLSYVAFVALILLVVVVVIVAAATGELGTIGRVIGTVLGAIVFCILYLLPTFIAARRQMPHVGSIAVINLLLGFTYIGWVVALAMAVAGKREAK
jgi:hypothetical protein